MALTHDYLNDLPIFACDIQNACLQVPSSEKYYIVCGPQFGLENKWKHTMIVRSLNGWKSSGNGYWRYASCAMEDMLFLSCKSDPDVQLWPSLKSNGFQFYQNVLISTDTALLMMEEPERFLREELKRRFTLKEKPIGSTDQYFGGKGSQVALENGVKCLNFSCSQCTQSAINNVEDY